MKSSWVVQQNRGGGDVAYIQAGEIRSENAPEFMGGTERNKVLPAVGLTKPTLE